ncbi:hypothetical protein CEE37_06710 [candidate division LCP-89 bacterium B3_LCP]|uniref:Phosphoribosyltransferase domain-containing protein n=1 Tax=candidate division LCP-89 bacterium B3_LCP TaxID=2012998 RepID=A0A532V0I6_UNCL8|nr:MAG: hypothetical protein CEE37_06710 [candidate division LCP-89 bacterium B3_LCP]
MEIQRLKRYSLVQETSENKQQSPSSWLLWVDSSIDYYHKLQSAFPEIHIELLSGLKAKNYNWCARITDLSEVLHQALERCLKAFSRTLCISSDADECFTLSWHSKSGNGGKPKSTPMGQWVQLAKSYSTDPHSRGSETVADLIAEQMNEFINRHPLYRTCDGILSVLPSNLDKAFDLPTYIAEKVARDYNIPYLNSAIFKKRRTAQMKFCLSLDDKLDNIANSVGVHSKFISGKNLLIIDDIIDSGMTIMETCRSLREAKARSIRVLIATKTLKRRFV